MAVAAAPKPDTAECQMEHDRSDLTDRLRLIAAWKTRGARTPAQPMPKIDTTVIEAAAEIERLQAALASRPRGLVVIEDDGTIRPATTRDV